MKKFLQTLRSNKGFTLLELIVGFTIITVLATVSVIGFSDYTETQQINQAAIDIELMIKEAKNNALSVVKKANDDTNNPIACDSDYPLISYQVTIAEPEFHLYMVCDSLSGREEMRIRTITLGNGINLISKDCSEIEFESLYANLIRPAATCVIQIGKNSKTKNIEINTSGNTKVD